MTISVRPANCRRDVMAIGARWSRWVVVASVALVSAAQLLPDPAYDGVMLCLVAAGLLAGLPHGAFDHRIGAVLTGWPTSVVAAGYAMVAALALLLLTVAGPFALVAVLTLSLAHFALGELEAVRESTDWNPAGVQAVAVGVAGTGALLLPLARAGPELTEVAASLSPGLGVLLVDGGVRTALAGVWGLAAVVAVVAALRAHQYLVALDVFLVGALGALAPPLVAFALWFGGWHALRHCARLLSVDTDSAALLTQGQPARAMRVLARAAMWPTVAAVGVLTGLVVRTATDPSAAVAQTLLVLLALTVPHMLVVLWLDRRRPVRT